jgi:hypothetical protein
MSDFKKIKDILFSEIITIINILTIIVKTSKENLNKGQLNTQNSTFNT